MATCWQGDGQALSAELGASTEYRWLRLFLDYIQPGHCLKAARDENLINR